MPQQGMVERKQTHNATSKLVSAISDRALQLALVAGGISSCQF